MIQGEYGGTLNTKLLLHLNGNSVNSIGNKASTDSNITYVPGKFGQCANFNGTNSNIKYTGSELTNLTVSFWFKSDSTNSANLIQQSRINGDNSFEISLLSSGEIIVVTYEDRYVGSKQLLSVGSPLIDGKWHNVITTRNGSTVNLYIDGVFNATKTDMLPFIVGNYYGSIGSHRSGHSWFNGQIDEIIIETIVWSATDVSNYYNTIFSSQTFGEFLPTPNTNGLFKLNGNSNNLIGNIASTDSNITYVPGKYGKCASFNGSNSFIYLGTSLNYNPTYMTVNAWVYPQSLTSNMDIIARDNTTSKRSYNISIQSNGTLNAEIFTTSSISSGIVNVTGATGAIVINKWYMISFTFDGTTAKLYLNGKLYGSSLCSAIYKQSVETYIGKRRITDNAVVFNGKMDEVIIENRAWSENEVRKYYTNYLGRFAIL